MKGQRLNRHGRVEGLKLVFGLELNLVHEDAITIEQCKTMAHVHKDFAIVHERCEVYLFLVVIDQRN
jgi:hypothetical protein